MPSEAFDYPFETYDAFDAPGILRALAHERGVGTAVKDLPSVEELLKAYRDTATELASSSSDYDRNRGRDLLVIAAALTTSDNAATIYRDALSALIGYKINLGHPTFREILLTKPDPLSWRGARHYAMIDPRRLPIPSGSALGQDPADPATDIKIAERIFAKLPRQRALFYAPDP